MARQRRDQQNPRLLFDVLLEMQQRAERRDVSDLLADLHLAVAHVTWVMPKDGRDA